MHKNKKTKWLVFDISNLLYRSFFVNRGETADTASGLATHSALVMLNKHFKIHKPDKVVMAFDRSSWRKVYTASDECLSKKPYKGNRRQDMTPSEKAKYAQFMLHMREFEDMVAEHTSIVSLVADRLEADDLVAGFCQVVADDDNEIVIISTDSDLFQLMQYPNVSIVSPATDEVQTLSEFNNDPLYYVFAKCIRGDSTDNVQSAFPRVRATRIEKAYNDPYERVQLMKETWTNQDKVEFTVEALFAENEKLINLAKQPNDIRELIYTSVDEALSKKRQFSMFFLLKFIGKHKLVKIKESVDLYVPMLSA